MKIQKDILYRCKTRADLESFLLQCQELGVRLDDGNDIYEPAVAEWNRMGHPNTLCFLLVERINHGALNSPRTVLNYDYYKKMFNCGIMFPVYYEAEGKDVTISDIQNKLSSIANQLFEVGTQLEMYSKLNKGE